MTHHITEAYHVGQPNEETKQAAAIAASILPRILDHIARATPNQGQRLQALLALCGMLANWGDAHCEFGKEGGSFAELIPKAQKLFQVYPTGDPTQN